VLTSAICNRRTTHRQICDDSSSTLRDLSQD